MTLPDDATFYNAPSRRLRQGMTARGGVSRLAASIPRQSRGLNMVFDFVPCSFVTTTSYGTWLPGDERGYVQHGQVLLPEPNLAQHAAILLKHPPVRFSYADKLALLDALTRAAEEFHYHLSDVAIESSHLHWIIAHDDSPESMVGRLKNRMRQALKRGRIWTQGFCCRSITRLAELEDARDYLIRHEGCCFIDGNRR